MPLFNHTKLFFILLAAINISGSLYCMENPTIDPTKLIYFPTEAPNDKKLMDMRIKLRKATPKTIQRICPAIEIVKIEKPWQRKGVCFYFALKESLQLTKQEMNSFALLGCEELAGKELNILNDYYEQTNYPHAGSLTIYYNSENNCSIEHFAKRMRDGRIKSKFATGKGIYIHPLWALRDDWGDRVVFYDLKKQFTGENGRNILLADLQNKLKNAPIINHELTMLKKSFLEECNGNDLTPAITVYRRLKQCPALDINIRDASGNTGLMLAAARGDLKIIKILTTHKAELYAQNNVGQTALILAAEKAHFNVVKFLLAQNY